MEVAGKLERMTNEEFAELEFVAVELIISKR